MILTVGILAVLLLLVLFFFKMDKGEEERGEAILGMELLRSRRYYYFELDYNHILTVFQATPIPDEANLNTYKFLDKTLDSIEFSKVYKRGKIELSEQEFAEIIRLADTVNGFYEEGFRLIVAGPPRALIYYNDKTHEVWTVLKDPDTGVYGDEDENCKSVLQLYDKLIELSPIELYS